MDNLEFYWELYSHIARILSILVRSVAAAFFAKPFMEKPKSAWAVGAACFLCLLVCNEVPYEMTGATAYTLFALTMCGAMYALEKRNIKQKIMLSTYFLLFGWIVHEIAIIPWNLMYDYGICRIEGAMMQLAACVVAEIIFLSLQGVEMYFFIKIIDRVYVNKEEVVSKQEFTIMFLSILPSLVGYYFFQWLENIYEKDTGNGIWNAYREYNWLIALYLIVSFGAMLVIIIMLQTVKRKQREERENAVLAGQIADMENHIHEVEKMYCDIRSLRHDMGNHIMTLENLYRREEWEEAEKYAGKIREALEVSPLSIKSSNPVTDIILEEMRIKAESRGISFQSDFAFYAASVIDTFDISVILNNALTNAIEGAASSNSKYPAVHVLSYRKRNAFMLEVRNSFTGELVLSKESGLPITNKEDGQQHGYGLSNIRRVAQKYHGDIMVQAGQGEFILTVMLMLE